MAALISFFGTLQSTLLRPVDAAWLAAFRVLYGTVLSLSMLRMVAYGWVDRVFSGSRFRFKYWGFEWIEPLSSAQMEWLVWALGGLALALAAGFAFRVTAALFALGLCYLQLLDASTYLNHYYLATLLAGLLCLSPAARAYSVDAWLRRRFRHGAPEPRKVAAAWLYLFRFQVGVVYVFAGLAKFGSDWLLHAQPLRLWLGASTSLPIVGPLLAVEWVPLALSWAGFLFDTSIVAWLSFNKTRPYAYAVLICFHLTTRLLFPIGMFPAIMTVAALVFFSPGFPRELANRAASLLGKRRIPVESAMAPALSPRTWQRAALAVGVAYCLIHVAVPLRFLAYGGNVLWHEQGMRYSWRVMVRAKGGDTTFVVRNKQTGRTWHVSPRSYLTALQESEMSGQPDLILQLAHHVRNDFERRGLGPVEVRADSQVSLNGRRGARLIDPRVDLLTIDDSIARASWVLPGPSEPPPHTRPVL